MLRGTAHMHACGGRAAVERRSSGGCAAVAGCTLHLGLALCTWALLSAAGCCNDGTQWSAAGAPGAREQGAPTSCSSLHRRHRPQRSPPLPWEPRRAAAAGEHAMHCGGNDRRAMQAATNSRLALLRNRGGGGGALLCHELLPQPKAPALALTATSALPTVTWPSSTASRHRPSPSALGGNTGARSRPAALLTGGRQPLRQQPCRCLCAVRS